MDLLMDGLLMTATLFAGGYCWVLARRVQDLKSLDRGLGGSIVTLTRQIELARLTLEEARGASRETKQDLTLLVGKAETAARDLRLLIAAAPVTPRRAPEPVSAPPAPPAPVMQRAEPRLTAPPLPERGEAGSAPERDLPKAQAVLPRARPILATLEPLEPAKPATPYLAEVPKPRALMPVENPLRRIRPGKAAPGEPPRSEDEILEALSALAGR